MRGSSGRTQGAEILLGLEEVESMDTGLIVLSLSCYVLFGTKREVPILWLQPPESVILLDKLESKCDRFDCIGPSKSDSIRRLMKRI